MPERYRVVSYGALPLLLSVPPNARPPVPVLLFLHGYGEAAPMDIRRALTLHGPLRASASPRAAAEFIIAAPQLPIAGDLWSRAAAAVQETVAAVLGSYDGDPRRVYVTGFSYGANGAFDLAAVRAVGWAGIWAVDPTRVPAQDPGCPVWVSLGGASRSLGERFVQALGLRPASPGVPAGERVFTDEGEDHVGTATRAYRDDRVYDWLLSKHRPRA